LRFRPTGGALLFILGLFAPVHAQTLRVELYSKTAVQEIRVYALKSPVRLCTAKQARTCPELKLGSSSECRIENGGVRCGVAKGSRVARQLWLKSAKEFRLEVRPAGGEQSDPSRGIRTRAAEVRAGRAGLRVIVAVDLETYVAGVLAGEAVTFKSPQGLAAMAVLARTWALRSVKRHRSEGFDFCSLTHCQFFRPPLEATELPPAIAKAVQDTAGLVLKYHGELIDAYYSANCGGMTAAAGDVWPDRARPYLQSVRDPYCAGAEQSSWTQKVSWNDIRQVLEKQGGAAPRDVAIDAKDSSGRVRTLRLTGGRPQRIDANEFRYALNRRLGWNTLKSSLFTLEPQGDSIVFHGRGLGHGVGLCQAGAEQMGKLGISYDQILAHYFPGTKLENAESAHPARVLSSEHFDLFFPPDEEGLAAKALQTLETHRQRLGDRARLLPARISVRTWETPARFIRATGQPGWVSGSNDGRIIDLQPLSVLQSRGNLGATLHHELLHVLIRRIRAQEVPRWYEEGLILYLTGEHLDDESGNLPVTPPPDRVFTSPRSAIETRHSYAWARQRVMELARRKGDAAIWQVLEHPSAEDLRWLESGK
jgi:stage II sporulation protein D